VPGVDWSVFPEILRVGHCCAIIPVCVVGDRIGDGRPGVIAVEPIHTANICSGVGDARRRGMEDDAGHKPAAPTESRIAPSEGTMDRLRDSHNECEKLHVLTGGYGCPGKPVSLEL